MLVMAFRLIVSAVVGIGGLFGIMALLYLTIKSLTDQPTQSTVTKRYNRTTHPSLHNQTRRQTVQHHKNNVTPFEKYQQYQKEREYELKNSRKVVDE